MDFQRFNSALAEKHRHDAKVIEGYWLANRDDQRVNTAHIERCLDTALDEVTARLDETKSAFAVSSQRRQNAIHIHFDALEAVIAAQPSLWQLTKEIVPVVLIFMPFLLAVAAFMVSILGGFS